VHAGSPTGLCGRHDELACGACHANADAPQLTWGQRRFMGLTSACTTCHDDTHEGEFGKRCNDCHGQEEPFASATGFDHTPFPLVGAHSDIACAACHADGHPVATNAEQRRVRECAVCHDDPHRKGPLVLAASGDCSRCHDATSFAAAEFDAAAHASIGAPLRGRHADAPCSGCHTPTRATTDLQTCSSCHDDVHAGAAQRPADGEPSALRTR